MREPTFNLTGKHLQFAGAWRGMSTSHWLALMSPDSTSTKNCTILFKFEVHFGFTCVLTEKESWRSYCQSRTVQGRGAKIVSWLGAKLESHDMNYWGEVSQSNGGASREL